jgi:hypothetical protein
MDTLSQQDEDEAHADDDNPGPEAKDSDSTSLLKNATNRHGSIPASDICKVLSLTIKRKPGMTAPPPALKQSIWIGGKKFISANIHVTYSISSHQCSNDSSALIDCGAKKVSLDLMLSSLKRCLNPMMNPGLLMFVVLIPMSLQAFSLSTLGE